MYAQGAEATAAAATSCRRPGAGPARTQSAGLSRPLARARRL